MNSTWSPSWRLLLGKFACALAFGRFSLLLLRDSEGPNLLVVLILGCVIFTSSMILGWLLERWLHVEVSLVRALLLQFLIVLVCYVLMSTL